MSAPKVCPNLTTDDQFVGCIEEECARWDGTQCCDVTLARAVVGLRSDMADLQNVLYGYDQRGFNVNVRSE